MNMDMDIKCIKGLHDVAYKIKYFASIEDDDISCIENLKIYKRILHIINRLLRLPDLKVEYYHTIYLWFKDEPYKSPWDQDALSKELLRRMAINLPVLLADNHEHTEEIKKCFQEEITNTIIEETDRILEL